MVRISSSEGAGSLSSWIGAEQRFSSNSIAGFDKTAPSCMSGTPVRPEALCTCEVFALKLPPVCGPKQGMRGVVSSLFTLAAAVALFGATAATAQDFVQQGTTI